MKFFPKWPWGVARFGGTLLLFAAFFVFAYFHCIVMPESALLQENTKRATQTPSDSENLQTWLANHIRALATDIGERNTCTEGSLEKAASYIGRQFQSYGYIIEEQEYLVGTQKVKNIIAELRGTALPDEILVVGAHYDTVDWSPGANDNTSGVAATLEIARMFAGEQLKRTVRFVAFVNEEPPFFQTEDMGSMVYATRCKDRKENIIGAVVFDTIGCFSDEPGSQKYPPLLSPFYPDTGNFIAFVGNLSSNALIKRCVSVFKSGSDLPCEGASLPGTMTGIGWSDHWSFWQMGYKALMITDTALFRYPWYHTPQDTPDKIDYPRMTKVVEGAAVVIRELANREP